MTTMSSPVVLQPPTLTLPYRHDGWTVEDLPDDVDFRYELVDGAVLVSPAAELPHDDMAAQLLLVLHPALPPGWRLTLAPGLCFDARNYRQPDVLVYRSVAVGHRWARPADTLLAVEIVRPSSVSTDRTAKPAQYAAAGIPHYWRVELDPLVLVAHVLDGAAYRVAGTFTDDVELTEPVVVSFRLSDLLP